ncbi:MAG TPA: SPOR domain-containing protein [Telluria sp.]|jgi:cell division protein FtsN
MTFRTLPSRQRGSTLTGIIIGLIIGLGIAVAVALTITKGASPFTDKMAKTGRPADPLPGQAQDPNKPMYANRDAAREANKEVTEKAAARSNGGAEPATAPAPAAPAATATASAVPASDDPLGQAIAGLKEPAPAKAQAHGGHVLATAAPVAAPAAAPSAANAAGAAGSGGGDYIYYLQAGSYRDLSDAESTRAKLALLGFEAAISDHSSDSGVLHRVRMGPYKQVETMNKARAKLLDSGVDVAIVRSQR